ncbi:hypothetical protein [Micromonospora vulcania]|uniref:Uncharacterized protein n=1 Tax=Micromonospora vulcania TaxID=1441873 RepID=A0ABW1H8C5_9ACTN
MECVGPGSGDGLAVGVDGPAVGDGAVGLGRVVTEGGLLGLGRPDGEAGVAGGGGVVAGSDRVLVGSAVGVDVGSGVDVGLGVGLGVGSGVSVGGSVGDGTGDGLGAEVVGGTPQVGRATGGGGSTHLAGAGSQTTGPGTDRSGVREGSGSQPGVAVGPTLGVPGGGRAGWLVIGIGITTGPTDGVGMNGMLLSGSAVLPGVAEPALIAARMGIDAVPANRATVSR